MLSGVRSYSSGTFFQGLPNSSVSVGCCSLAPGHHLPSSSRRTSPSVNRFSAFEKENKGEDELLKSHHD
ncbi:hypothetical protein AGIG_G20508 [Arapaima gigas]